MAAQLDCLKQRWRKLTVSGPPFLEQDHVCRVQVASGVQKFQPAVQSVFQTGLSVPSSLPQPTQNAEINADTGLHQDNLQKQSFLGYTLVYVTISFEAPKSMQVFKTCRFSHMHVLKYLLRLS